MKNSDVSEKEDKVSAAVLVARAIARNPCRVLVCNVIAAIAISAIAFFAGEFELEIDNTGWLSRGTVIANRQYQYATLRSYKYALFSETDGSLWEELTSVVQPGFEVDEDERRKLSAEELKSDGMRKTQMSDTCDISLYEDDQFVQNNLVAIWKSKGQSSILDASSLRSICQSEVETISVLKERQLCYGCSDESCLQPVSLVLALRVYLDEMDSSCEALIDQYNPLVQSTFTELLANCTDDIRKNYNPAYGPYYGIDNYRSCPDWFKTTLVDEQFGEENAVIRYTSSYFLASDYDGMYGVVDDFSKGEDSDILGVYETNYEDFTLILLDDELINDMVLATLAGIASVLAMILHTKSIWLSLMGILQIVFSIPLAYFIYYFIGRLSFFPFLNFIGVFVLFALGADDVFVATDKWKNARLQMPKATTEEIAAVALPNAAGAMLLTTSTTAVAFFATAICPVAPIMCFVVYCGLLIIMDYFLNMMLVFPSLCLYDKWIMSGNTNCFVTFSKRNSILDENDEESEVNRSLISRILQHYYTFLHKFRIVLGIVSVVALAICLTYAIQLDLPETAEVRLLPDSHQFQKHFLWKQELFSSSLTMGRSDVHVVWGLEPADTGNHNNPQTGTALVLDESFAPTSSKAQIYLVNFCERLFETEFASKPYDDYQCPINEFNSWLQSQSNFTTSVEYTKNCDGATSIPLPENIFEKCIISWGKLNRETNILDDQGTIKTMVIKTSSIAKYNSPYNILDNEWNKFQNWFEDERSVAPAGVNSMFFTSSDFHWYDTNGKILQTAFGAAGIAIGFSTLVVLIASRSFILTLFSSISILYVLVATTATLVALGWTLGFLESICFAILIGISCDFVIHFSHAYKHHTGELSRNERTKYALIHMGPSILAAAATTLTAAIVMLFCQVTFFTKFATILFMTILHAVIATFVIFLVLVDTLGPSQPARFVNNTIAKCFGKI